ncbi:MAG: DUF4143 domain-containing protein [Kineosporiaceae bacterium]|nr:DUF4143 domain-containing protein [Kineosporiaceae bacterium]
MRGPDREGYRRIVPGDGRSTGCPTAPSPCPATATGCRCSVRREEHRSCGRTRAAPAAKCASIGVDADQLLRPDSAFGALLEGFVLMELARQLSWSRQRAELFHYRTRDQVEVDAVIESRSGKVVAVEVKASGIVLYTGQQTLPFGPRLRAMPISALWQTGTQPPRFDTQLSKR